MSKQNYTRVLREHLYDCIKGCQHALDACHAIKKVEDPSMDKQVRQELSDACSACIDKCKLAAHSAAEYLKHATETDSRAQVLNAVEHINICVANCNHIITTCDTMDNRCVQMVDSCINTIEDCIASCREAAEHPEL